MTRTIPSNLVPRVLRLLVSGWAPGEILVNWNFITTGFLRNKKNSNSQESLLATNRWPKSLSTLGTRSPTYWKRRGQCDVINQNRRFLSLREQKNLLDFCSPLPPPPPQQKEHKSHKRRVLKQATDSWQHLA